MVEKQKNLYDENVKRATFIRIRQVCGSNIPEYAKRFIEKNIKNSFVPPSNFIQTRRWFGL